MAAMPVVAGLVACLGCQMPLDEHCTCDPARSHPVVQEASCAPLLLLEPPTAAPAVHGTADPAASSTAVTARPWHLLVDGVLAAGCAAIRDAPDAHFKFHAACVLNFCVGKLLESWQQQERGSGEQQEQGREQEQEQEGQQEGEEGRGAGGVRLVPAVLHPSGLEEVMALMWANLDEPLAQTARQVGRWAIMLLHG